MFTAMLSISKDLIHVENPVLILQLIDDAVNLGAETWPKGDGQFNDLLRWKHRHETFNISRIKLIPTQPCKRMRGSSSPLLA